MTVERTGECCFSWGWADEGWADEGWADEGGAGRGWLG